MNTIFSQTEQAVRTSGEIILEQWHKPKEISRKGRIDLVTQTDLAVEKDLKVRLAKIIPDSIFLSEETSSATRLKDKTWIIDPIDGTTNYAHGFPFVAVSVALWDKEQLEMGFVYMPVMQEMFSAQRGHGARLNGRPISTSDVSEPEQALIGTGFPYSVREEMKEILSRLEKILAATQGVRRPGSAACDLAYTACGRLDGFYETSLNAWDTAAGVLLVQEAGGKVSRFNGSPYSLGDSDIIASNRDLHSWMCDTLT